MSDLDMTRPGFIDGVCLVANAVGDATFLVDASRDAIDAALASLKAHDRMAVLAPGSRRVLGRDDQDDGGPVVDVGPAFGDWVDGYGAALAGLAESIPLEQGPTRPDAVAVIGVRLDRREGDRLGDLDEVARMVGALGLDVRASWPSPGGLDALSGVAGAATLVALPYGREAARRLASRTGARVVETGLPIGLDGTSAWVMRVAEATGTIDVAEAFLAAELDRAAPRLEWVIPHSLLHRRLCLGGDGPWIAAWAGALSEVGCRIVAAVLTGGSLPDSWNIPVMDSVPGPDAVDLCIGDRACVEAAIRIGTPALERGMPSPNAHFLTPSPALGIPGLLGMVEAVINRLSLETALRDWRHPGSPPEGPQSYTTRPADR